MRRRPPRSTLFPYTPLFRSHVAGAYLPPDIFARYHRLKGNAVLVVSGSDCHGTPITLEAERRGITPQEVDRKSTRLNSSHANISYAVFCLKKKKYKHPTLTH